MQEPLTQILNYHTLDSDIATGGQPTAAQFQLLRAEGFETVINLARPDSPGAIANESDIVRDNHMQYVTLPVDFKQPRLEDLREFFAVMHTHQQQKCFIHCAYNWRVSVFMYLYRVLVRNMDEEPARADLEKIWSPDPVWTEFINRAKNSLANDTGETA